MNGLGLTWHPKSSDTPCSHQPAQYRTNPELTVIHELQHCPPAKEPIIRFEKACTSFRKLIMCGLGLVGRGAKPGATDQGRRARAQLKEVVEGSLGVVRR